MNKKKSFAERNARVSRPERTQVEMQLLSLEQMLPKDHRCRIVWRFVQSLDLEAFYAEIRVTDSDAGRSAIAPEILVSLWFQATLDGISSARELGRRCETDMPYLWLCGGVSVNYHTLSDFRVAHADKLDQILTTTIAALMHQDLVTLEELGQDGMRVRASAGSSSFRRKPTLQTLHRKAKEHVDQLREESESESSDHAKLDARRKAAAERAAREQEERIRKALEESDQLSKQREKRKRGEGEKTRVSTTDREARRMKMANGGYRPAYNVQFASDSGARVIVGVDVTNQGTDGGQLPPMLDQIEERYDRLPEYMQVDSAYATKNSVTDAESRGVQVISTVPRADQLKRHGKDPHHRQRGDSDEYERFRARMAEPKYVERYKQRPSIAEFPNADCRNRGLGQFRVCGVAKVKAVALWHALAFNFMRMINLGAIESCSTP
jgi:transposase